MKSSCCSAPMTVYSADEGTSFYVCSVCKNPCNPVADDPMPTPPAKEEGWEIEFDERYGMWKIQGSVPINDTTIKDFIRLNRSQAYEEGKREAIREIRSTQHGGHLGSCCAPQYAKELFNALKGKEKV